MSNLSEKPNRHYENRLQQLRDEAEKRLALGRAKLTPLEMSAQKTPQTTDILLRELEVQQIELEMQADELQRANTNAEDSRNRYINLYEFAPIGYFSINADGIATDVNLKAAAMLGIERNHITKHRFEEFVANQDRDFWYKTFVSLKNEVAGKEYDLTLMIQRHDGSTFYSQINCLRVAGADNLEILRITIVDVSKLKQAEADLRIAAIAFESQEGIFITDANSVILKTNKAFTNITGYSAVDAIGKTPRLLSSGRHDDQFYKSMWDSINSKGVWHGELWNKRKNGEIYAQLLTITAVVAEQGSSIHYVGALLDITEKKEAIAQIEKLAFYDPLTNTPNRRLLLERIKHALAATNRSGQNGALLFIDVDNFKILNDTLGHDVGDLLLQQIAHRLANCVREGDTVARIGGDEFVVMLENVSENTEAAAKQTKITAEKILETLNEPYRLETHDYHCTSSIGIILFSGHQAGIDELLKRVDIAMYQAKHNGRNKLCFFDEKMQSDLEARVKLDRDLELAIINDEFRVYYQKQVTIDGKSIGAEALIRWLHPERGLVSPMEFIPAAEDNGLILKIGLWVLESACQQLKTWEGGVHTQHLHLAVNVSARQFYQVDFVAQVTAIIKKTAIDPSKLELELTETLVLDNILDAIKKMTQLNKLGIKFSIDDFGTGYSSLAYLTQLPLSFLKIDKSFVHNIGLKPTYAVIVQTIIGMAKNLGMSVIAEGVESNEQLAFLALNGCHLYQGFLFSKPVPLIEYEQLLSLETCSPRPV